MRGCKARFQESTARPFAAFADPQSQSAPNRSYNHRTFYRNNHPICAETWEGVPENSLLRKVVIPGEAVTLEYDEFNRLIKLTRTDTMTDKEPRVTRIHYYAGGHITMDGPRDDVDDIQHLTVDENGNIVEFIDAAGHRYLTEFDAQGRRIAWEGPNGERREFEYNSQNQIELERSAPGTAQQISLNLRYDEAGRLASSQRTGEGLIGRSYDETGRLTRISDHRGEQLHLRYGAAGKLEEIVASRELGMAITESLSGKVYEADPLHPADPRMLSRLVPSGLDQPVEYQFDELDRIVAILTTDGTVSRFEYNGFGELLAEHSPMLGTTRYGYDAGGNRIWEARSDGTEIRRSFDTVSRVIRLEYQRPGTPSQEIQYRYDNCRYGVGRLCEVTAPGSVTRYDYDVHGNTILRRTS